MNKLLDTILHDRQLHAVFQPIVATSNLGIVGYEGLIRGPMGSDLESPAALFACARHFDRQRDLEYACIQTIWKRFERMELPGKLFMNVSPRVMLASKSAGPELDEVLDSLKIDPTRVVIELTEEQAVDDYSRLREVARRLSVLGYEWAIDDLGAGYASLRLWLELRPACVKIDNAFVQGSDDEALKQCFLDAVQQLAVRSNARVIAEGVETLKELDVLRRLGIAYAQGYYIARPSAKPPLRISLP